jgi:hypothetical protein
MGVSDIIKRNLGNLTGGGALGIAAGIAGSLFDKSKNNMAQNAAAAKILNKSPLEINDTSPVAHMKSNPYEYGTVFYPENVQNLGTGHYIIFDILETDTGYGQLWNSVKKGSNRVAEFLGNDPVADKANLKESQMGGYKNTRSQQAAQSRVVKASSGINAGTIGERHSRVSDTLILYTPPGLKTSYSVQHEGTETGMLGDILGAKLGSPADLVGRIKEVSAKLGTEIASMAVSLIPGAGDLKGALQKATGRAFNPNLEMVFKGVPMREFDYTFEFAPKNQKELESAQKIIQKFKFHMHPELSDMGNDFIVPSQFQITYMYMENRNTYIPKISKCVLKSLDLQHGDEGVFSTFAADAFGAAPIYTKMVLKFAETEIMTKGTISQGF